MSRAAASGESKPTLMITGAAGFIGTALRQCLRVEYDLICIDLLPAPSLSSGEEWHQMDVTDVASVERLLRRLQKPLSGLIHLAWYYDFSNLPHPRYQAAADSMATLVAAFGRYAASDAPFIFASSMAAMAPTVPGVKQTAASPRSAAWQYPASKVRGEKALRSVTITQPVVELVFAGVYSDACELVPLFQSIERIRRGNIQSWFFPGRTDRGLTYVHVDDVTRAIRSALRASYPTPRLIQRLLVGEARPVTNQEIFDAASAAFGRVRVPILKVPPFLAWLGAQVIGLFSRSNFVKPWMIAFAEEHFEFDLAHTEAVIGWTPQKRLLDTLPTMLAMASGDTDMWLSRNERRPWRRAPELGSG
ncbi:MAG: NAD(P)-dependent oxidoreductase [Deltaproteobacteria bacterium]|nr:NAD(P)-dependent oxidoreductase [Deltaproteobacteria bacterium]